nr:hypothetical protein [Actinomyces ruminis]
MRVAGGAGGRRDGAWQASQHAGLVAVHAGGGAQAVAQVRQGAQRGPQRGVQGGVAPRQFRVDPDRPTEVSRQALLHAEGVERHVGERPIVVPAREAGDAVSGVLHDDGAAVVRLPCQLDGLIASRDAEGVLDHQAAKGKVWVGGVGGRGNGAGGQRQGVGVDVGIARGEPRSHDGHHRRATGEHLGEDRPVAVRGADLLQGHLHAVACLENRVPVLRAGSAQAGQFGAQLRETAVGLSHGDLLHVARGGQQRV